MGDSGREIYAVSVHKPAVCARNHASSGARRPNVAFLQRAGSSGRTKSAPRGPGRFWTLKFGRSQPWPVIDATSAAKSSGLLLHAFAEGEAREGLHGHRRAQFLARLGDQLLDGLVRVHDEGLLQQHHFFLATCGCGLRPSSRRRRRACPSSSACSVKICALLLDGGRVQVVRSTATAAAVAGHVHGDLAAHVPGQLGLVAGAFDAPPARRCGPRPARCALWR